jgi:predicted porin
VGYVYWLSKRSNLYATVARIDNESAATFAIPGGSPIAAGGNSTGAELGVRHSF